MIKERGLPRISLLLFRAVSEKGIYLSYKKVVRVIAKNVGSGISYFGPVLSLSASYVVLGMLLSLCACSSKIHILHIPPMSVLRTK